jgi:kinesin family member 6/9
MVDTFVKRAAVDGDWDSRLTGLSGDLARMYYCYDVLRERLIKGGSPAKGGETSTVKVEEQRALLEESAAQIEVLRKSVQLKENELQVLLTVLKRAGMSGGGGGAGGGLAGARFNAFTQTQAQQTGSGSNSNNNGGGGEAAALSFTDAVLSAEADAELRQRIYHEAQQLIRQLRRTAGASGTDGGGALPAEVVMPNPAMSRVAAEAAAQAALTRVTMLAQQGQLTEAEAFAATEFLESKKGLQLRQPPQPTSQDADGGDRDSSGNGGDSRSAVDVLMDERLLQDRAQALEAFKATYEAQHKVEATKQLLKPKYESCKTTAQQLNACVDAMKQLKTRIQRRRAERAADGSDVVDSEETAWLEELRATKECYNTLAAQLRQDKEEIDGMHAYLKHAQEQLVRDFERWFSARQQQVQLAVQQQQRHHHAQHEKELEARQAAGLAHDLRVALDGVGGDAAALRGVHNGDNKSPLANAAETPSPPLEGNEKSEHRETPANAVHSSTSHTNAHIGNSGSGAVSAASYQALSAPIPPSVAARPYPSSAPVNSSSGNTNAVLRQPYTYAASGCVSTGEGTVPAAASLTSLPSTSSSDPPRFPATARAQNRLALLPTHMLADPAFASTPPQHPSSFSARTPEVTRHDETTSLRALGGAAATAAATLSASFPTGTAAPLLGAGKVNGWIGPAGGAGTSGAGGVGGSLTSSPTRPFHLQPLTGSPSSQRASPSPSMQQQQPPPPSNPFFPQFPSTGNAAADEQLAQLYKAREAMRKQLQ